VYFQKAPKIITSACCFNATTGCFLTNNNNIFLSKTIENIIYFCYNKKRMDMGYGHTNRGVSGALNLRSATAGVNGIMRPFAVPPGGERAR